VVVTDDFTIRRVLLYSTNKNKGMCQITAQQKGIHYCTACVCNTTQHRRRL